MNNRTIKLDTKRYLLIFCVRRFGRRRFHYVLLDRSALLHEGLSERLPKLVSVEVLVNTVLING